MGKRSAKRVVRPKRKPKLQTTFQCPMCYNKTSLRATLEKTLGVGSLSCDSCNRVNYQCDLKPFEEAIDVYTNFSDALDAESMNQESHVRAILQDELKQGVHQDYAYDEAPGEAELMKDEASDDFLAEEMAALVPKEDAPVPSDDDESAPTNDTTKSEETKSEEQIAIKINDGDGPDVKVEYMEDIDVPLGEPAIVDLEPLE